MSMGWDFLWTATSNGLIVHPPHDIWEWKAMTEWYWHEKNRRTWRKTCPSATLSATNPTWIHPCVNPSCHSDRPATNHLRHSKASYNTLNRMVLVPFRQTGSIHSQSHVADMPTSMDGSLNILVLKLHFPWALLPFQYHVYGAKIKLSNIFLLFTHYF
jgi:hypothetical protein